MTAELWARITTGRAAYNDFHSEVREYLDHDGDGPDWHYWAYRLSGVLIVLADEVEDYLRGPGQAQPGGGWISGPSNPP